MRRNTREFLTIIGVVALGVGGAVVLKTWQPFGGEDHPSEWDPRVTDFVDFVEESTNRSFEHPVRVVFQDDAEFEKSVRTDESELDEGDKADLADLASSGRALGLFSGETDVFEQTNDLMGSGILAYYSYDDRSIVVRLPEGKGEDDIVTADDLPVDLRVTVTHELTHALQDQLYDLSDVRSQAENSGQQSAILGLIEGNAVWVERHYFQSLSQDDQNEYLDANESAVGDFEEETADVSPVLSFSQSLPYVIGPALVTAVYEDGGAAAIDDAFGDDLPLAEDQLLLPTAYLDGDEPEEIETPETPDGAEALDEDTLGAPTLYLMFSTGMPAIDALSAIGGWGNDAIATYRDDDTVCVDGAVIGDDDESTALLAEGLRAWAEARPDGSGAVVEEGSDGEPVTFTACDPGTDEDQVVPSDEAIQQLVARSQDMTSYLPDAEGTVEENVCFIDGLYTSFPVSELDPNDAAVTAKAQELFAIC